MQRCCAASICRARTCLARALPEGVIEPGGKVSGFVYFPGVGADVKRVRLRADLVNAQTGETLVPLALPFVVG